MFVFKKRKKKPGFVYICDMRLTYFPVNLLWPIYSIRRCRSVKVKHSLKKYDLTRSESTLSVLLDAKMKADRRRPNDLMFLVCRIHLKHADNYMHCSAASLYYYILYTYIVGAKHVFDPRDSCESSAIFPRVLLRPFPDSLMKASLFAAVFIFNVFFFFFFFFLLLCSGALDDPQGYVPLESGSSFIQMPTDTTDPFSFGVLLVASCEHLSCISAGYIPITAPSTVLYSTVSILYTMVCIYLSRKLLFLRIYRRDDKGTANSIYHRIDQR